VGSYIHTEVLLLGTAIRQSMKAVGWSTKYPQG
jgi:hypothetical protein